MNFPLTKNANCNPTCRACHYKGLLYSEQLQRKEDWAQENLMPWIEVLQPIRPAPEEDRLAYRSKTWLRVMELAGEVSFGMVRSVYREGHWEKEFVAWDTCPLHSESIQTVIRNFRRHWFNLPEKVRSGIAGIWLGAPHCVVVGREWEDPQAFEGLDWFSILVPPFKSVWFHSHPQIAHVGGQVFCRRPIHRIDGQFDSSDIPVRAFRQVAQSLLVEARALAVDLLMKSQPQMILDLYCGVGDLSLLIPETTGWLGIEMNSDAVRFAQSCRNQSDDRIHEAFVGAVQHRLRDPRVLEKISDSYSLFINPPRTGLGEEGQDTLLHFIHRRPPRSLVYLSCSASGLARDLEVFSQAGYQVKFLQPYDFFPQTEHFETLAHLSR